MIAEIIIYWLLGLLLFTASLAFSLLAWRFWTLRDTVIVSIREMGELMVLLAEYDHLERPEEQVARILKMTQEEAKLEIERGRLMHLIGLKAAGILEGMKASIPDARKLIAPIESRMGRS